MKSIGMNPARSRVALIAAALLVALAITFGFAGTAHAATADEKVEAGKTYSATVSFKKMANDEASMIETAGYLSKTVSIFKDTDGTFKVDLFVTDASKDFDLTIMNEDGSVAPKQQPATGGYAFFRATVKTLNSPFVIKAKLPQMPEAQSARVVVDANSIAAASNVFKRLGGADAFGTMDLNVREGWTHSDRVIVATFSSYHDALAASSLAGLYDAPILITFADSLHPTTAQLIRDLQAQEAYIVGGTAAVNDSVKEAIRGCLIGSKKVERYWGDDAQKTAVAIANAKESVSHSSMCLVATSKTYHDALAASPFAYDKTTPIYLTDAEGNLSKDTIAAIKARGYDTAVIVGGPAVVQTTTEGILKSQAGVKDALRKWGDDAYITSFRFAQYGLENSMRINHMGVATINDFYDALTGGPLCGKNDAVLVLAGNDTTGHQNTLLVKENKDQIATGYVFGGTAALDDGVLKAFEDATR